MTDRRVRTMADTQHPEPTDAELDELRQANGGKLNFVTFSEFRTIARAVLAKWGTPPAEQAIPGVQWQCGPQANGFTAPQADSQPAGADRHGLPPLPDPDLRDVGTTPRDIKNFLRGYATEYAKVALAARAPAYSVLEDAAQVEIDLFNDLNRIYGNTLPAYAKELCRLGYRKTNAARKQGETNEH